MKERFISFIKSMYSSDSGVSSKRVHGSIGYLIAIVYIGIFAHDLIGLLLATSAALLGLETIVNIFKK